MKIEKLRVNRKYRLIIPKIHRENGAFGIHKSILKQWHGNTYKLRTIACECAYVKYITLHKLTYANSCGHWHIMPSWIKCIHDKSWQTED